MEEGEIKDRDPGPKWTGPGRKDAGLYCSVDDGSWLGRRGFVMVHQGTVYFGDSQLRTWVPSPSVLPPLHINSTRSRTPTHTQCPSASASASGTSLFRVSTSCPTQRHTTKRNGNESLCRIPGTTQRHLDLGRQPGPGGGGEAARMSNREEELVLWMMVVARACSGSSWAPLLL